MKTAVGMYGHEIVAEHHGITEDGARYFGLMELRSTYGDYTDTLGLRNSHDKSFPVGIGFGSRVFVCDNLAFLADTVIKRRHTTNLKRDLPGIIGEIIEPLAIQRERQARTIARYQAAELTDRDADHGIMEMYRQGIINIQRVPDVLQQWNEPEHDWGGPTAWRLLNAATFALAGRVMEKPDATPRLFNVIDGVCEHLH